MEEREWDELPVHCLVEVFRRVGLESLMESLPFVCKSWYEATLYPQCWQQLIFHKTPSSSIQSSSMLGGLIQLYKDHEEEFDFSSFLLLQLYKDHAADALESFIRFAVERSHGLVTDLVFPPHSHLKQGQIIWIAQRCPSLKLLVLPNYLSYVINFEVSKAVCNLKDLESLQVSSLIGFKKTIENISRNCPKFRHLGVYVPAPLYTDEALAIASHLPRLTTLDLRLSTIERDDLIIILKGCHKLQYLDISQCHVDNEILKLAHHVHSFKHK